jgi:hypothetical protein
MQGELLGSHLHSVLRGVFGHRLAGRIKSQLGRLLLLRIEDRDDLDPPLAAPHVHLFGDGPVTMFFAVFESPMAVEKALAMQFPTTLPLWLAKTPCTSKRLGFLHISANR